MLTTDLIEEAAAFLEGRVRRTPVEYAPELSEEVGVPVWLKCEHLQVTGSFKVRGALFRMSRLTAAERRAGVVTCSAGNHGKGLAYAARLMQVHATVYVPATIDAAKYRAMLALGAEVIRTPYPGYDEAEAFALAEAERTGRPFISAFDEVAIMAGNGGTLAQEILEQVPDVQGCFVPVGGGGLAAGFTFWLRDKAPHVKVMGCQHEDSAALLASLMLGRVVTGMAPIATVAGGIEGGIGHNTFAVLQGRIDGVVTAGESELCEAVRWMLDHHQYLVEPSAAVTIACLRKGMLPPDKGPVVVVLSGRNVSLETLRTILEEGRKLTR
jgi:threonine dehydratase